MFNLLQLQFGCLLLNVILAFILILFRVHTHRINTRYETVRWEIIAALLFCAIHYWVQMKYGFRAQGDDVGALINILFYAPVAYLLCFTTVQMASTRNIVNPYLIVAIISYALILACFGIGYYYYQSLHMPIAMFSMAAIFLISIIFLNYSSVKEYKRVRKLVLNETGGDIKNYLMYMRAGTMSLQIISCLVPLAVLSTISVLIIAPFFLLSLLFYVVSFIAMSYQITSVSEVVDSYNEEQSAEEKTTEEMSVSPQVQQELSEEQIKNIEQAIARWIDEGGYRDSELNSTTMAMRIGVKRSELSAYILQEKGNTFRVWLSALRVEQAKRLLIEHSDYSIESIAIECGFNSRSWLQQKFRIVTGMTPTEWRESYQLKNNSSHI